MLWYKLANTFMVAAIPTVVNFPIDGNFTTDNNSLPVNVADLHMIWVDNAGFAGELRHPVHTFFGVGIHGVINVIMFFNTMLLTIFEHLVGLLLNLASDIHVISSITTYLVSKMYSVLDPQIVAAVCLLILMIVVIFTVSMSKDTSTVVEDAHRRLLHSWGYFMGVVFLTASTVGIIVFFLNFTMEIIQGLAGSSLPPGQYLSSTVNRYVYQVINFRSVLPSQCTGTWMEAMGAADNGDAKDAMRFLIEQCPSANIGASSFHCSSGAVVVAVCAVVFLIAAIFGSVNASTFVLYNELGLIGSVIMTDYAAAMSFIGTRAVKNIVDWFLRCITRCIMIVVTYLEATFMIVGIILLAFKVCLAWGALGGACAFVIAAAALWFGKKTFYLTQKHGYPFFLQWLRDSVQRSEMWNTIMNSNLPADSRFDPFPATYNYARTLQDRVLNRAAPYGSLIGRAYRYASYKNPSLVRGKMYNTLGTGLKSLSKNVQGRLQSDMSYDPMTSSLLDKVTRVPSLGATPAKIAPLTTEATPTGVALITEATNTNPTATAAAAQKTTNSMGTPTTSPPATSETPTVAAPKSIAGITSQGTVVTTPNNFATATKAALLNYSTKFMGARSLTSGKPTTATVAQKVFTAPLAGRATKKSSKPNITTTARKTVHHTPATSLTQASKMGRKPSIDATSTLLPATQNIGYTSVSSTEPAPPQTTTIVDITNLSYTTIALPKAAEGNLGYTPNNTQPAQTPTVTTPTGGVGIPAHITPTGEIIPPTITTEGKLAQPITITFGTPNTNAHSVTITPDLDTPATSTATPTPPDSTENHDKKSTVAVDTKTFTTPTVPVLVSNTRITYANSSIMIAEGVLFDPIDIFISPDAITHYAPHYGTTPLGSPGLYTDLHYNHIWILPETCVAYRPNHKGILKSLLIGIDPTTKEGVLPYHTDQDRKELNNYLKQLGADIITSCEETANPLLKNLQLPIRQKDIEEYAATHQKETAGKQTPNQEETPQCGEITLHSATKVRQDPKPPLLKF